jgi:hypothetical protein
MKRPAAFFPIAFALTAISIAPVADAREEGPIEIEKCQTIDKSGSYKLVKNLIASGNAENCLVITADSVTIDLDGFMISNSGVNGVAILAAPPSSVELGAIAVRNGSISTLNFASGVDLNSAVGSIVEGLRISGASLAQGAAISAKGIVKGNTVISFRGAGIGATGTVTGNYVDGTLFGISVGEGSTVIGNTVLNSVPEGLVVSCPSNVINNTVTSFGGANLVLKGEGCNSEGNVAP